MTDKDILKKNLKIAGVFVTSATTLAAIGQGGKMVYDKGRNDGKKYWVLFHNFMKKYQKWHLTTMMSQLYNHKTIFCISSLFREDIFMFSNTKVMKIY